MFFWLCRLQLRSILILPYSILFVSIGFFLNIFWTRVGLWSHLSRLVDILNLFFFNNIYSEIGKNFDLKLFLANLCIMIF